jgi:UDP-N-acetylmuramate dehydrogenase
VSTTDYTRFDKLCEELAIPIERDAPLREHCTFKVGGPADRVAAPGGEEQLRRLLCVVAEDALPLLVLGKGSNVLVSDAGFRGVVVLLGSGFAAIRLLDETTIECESGLSLSQLCLFAWEHSLAGLEFAYGIPGSVGGAIYMNAGAYGGEIKDVILSARHLDRQGRQGEFDGDELALSYRCSAYSADNFVITGGVFRLQKGDKTEIRARMDDYMNRRRQKQPLEYPSAGSTFKRPEGDYASALIDRCGLKGRRVGGAMVSEKHAGFVINAGEATCADILALIDEVRCEVREKTGFELECEVRLIE